MGAFKTRVDIANRALQHCSTKHIKSFADFSPQAHEVSECYDRIREAELRRNVWRFSVRRSVLRPIDTNTVLWTPPTWAAGSYSVGAVVVDSLGDWWENTVASNTLPPSEDSANGWQHYFGNDSADPLTNTANPLLADLSYYAGELVTYSGQVYRSLTSTNTDIPPTSKWLAVNGTTTALQILYPIGTGPVQDSFSLNVYRLPHGFLRHAPEDPRSGINPTLGAPTGPIARDWMLEGDYIVSAESLPLMLRYAADVVDVTQMDAMFCEGLACSIATTIVTADDIRPEAGVTALIGKVEREYRRIMGEARLVNGIEEGTVEPEEDDFITCRM